jgi:hypothetical protein
MTKTIMIMIIWSTIARGVVRFPSADGSRGRRRPSYEIYALRRVDYVISRDLCDARLSPFGPG